jgi:ABC-type sugar transport system substrate-binding protein
MKRIFTIALLLLFIAAGFGFAQKVNFAYMPGIEDPFMRMIEKGAAAKAKELGPLMPEPDLTGEAVEIVKADDGSILDMVRQATKDKS